MRKSLQVTIADPCAQQWEGMSEAAGGRYCGSCRKTVVDFSAMSDREILSWMAGAGGAVCGRLSTDQLNRSLLPMPERRRGWKGAWSFLLAGFLVAVRVQAQPKMPQPSTQQVSKKIAHGLPTLSPLAVDTSVPKFKILPTVTVVSYGIMGRARLISIVCTKDTLKEWVTDTLARAGIIEREVRIYPDPAPRGSVLTVSLQLRQSGTYQLGLFNSAGALIQVKSVELSDKAQTELLNIPASLPGGIYFVRVSGVEMKKVYTKKLVIL